MAEQISTLINLVSTQRMSACCTDVEFIISTSSSGQFVQAACRGCYSVRLLGREETRSLPFGPHCDSCHQAMSYEDSPHRSYGYRCSKCEEFAFLGHLVPSLERFKGSLSRAGERSRTALDRRATGRGGAQQGTVARSGAR